MCGPCPTKSACSNGPAGQIDLVVMHCTELPDLATAREYGERELYDSGTGNSGHFYIDRDGAVHLFARPTRIANHTRGYNPRSIGIELVNTGRFPGLAGLTPPGDDRGLHRGADPFADCTCLQSLRRELPGLGLIAGHEDLDTTQVAASDDATRMVSRKRDPGPLFPWERVLSEARLQRFMP
jgi:N-acetylmuramoyl-L-alanine amidase